MTRPLARIFALILPALPAGCAGTAPPVASVIAVGPPAALVEQAVASAAAQIRRCYHQPLIPWAGLSIVTWLEVHYDSDGSLGGWQVIGQEGITSENRAYAQSMARAATQAVIACSPIHLPPELHRGGWDAFELGFAFSVRV
jgi:hypothetical protein